MTSQMSFPFMEKEFVNISKKKNEMHFHSDPEILKIETLNQDLKNYFNSKLVLDDTLTRQLVSFQANKEKEFYRWYKYKEGFSAELVKRFIISEKIKENDCEILDPFAGSGTALFVASELGIKSCGIELLSIGQQIIQTRKTLEQHFSPSDYKTLNHWIKNTPWQVSKKRLSIPILRITEGAYPHETVEEIEQYMALSQEENENVKTVLNFALICILESVSYIRKDGQYLRWDYRSKKRPSSKPFDKGTILDFETAIIKKLREIVDDMSSYGKSDNQHKNKSEIKLIPGSCLNHLPTLAEERFDIVITSPPYCNRYDYTRTYALELAMLGNTESDILKLRQEMLSCTVENRAKDLFSINPNWLPVLKIVENQDVLNKIIIYLENQKTKGLLNNNGIPRMVKGYFFEMSCVIYELFRVIKSGGKVYMVNDNVRYCGISISVDLILSKIAEDIGFKIDKILYLPGSKGNSSQQMGSHGRDPLRKCVYVWRKN